MKIFSENILRVQERIYSKISDHKLILIQDSWNKSITQFINNFSLITVERKKFSNQLKYRLSHPQYAQELEKLNTGADFSIERVHILITQVKSEISESFSKIAIDSLDLIEYVFVTFTGLLNGMIMIHNINSPRKH